MGETTNRIKITVSRVLCWMAFFTFLLAILHVRLPADPVTLGLLFWVASSLV